MPVQSGQHKIESECLVGYFCAILSSKIAIKLHLSLKMHRSGLLI